MCCFVIPQAERDSETEGRPEGSLRKGDGSQPPSTSVVTCELDLCLCVRSVSVSCVFVFSVGVSWVFVFSVCGQCWCELGLCV